jgi:hypothetical protein
MRRSDGDKQQDVLSEEAPKRQQICDLAAFLQKTSPIAAHQVLPGKIMALSRLAVE